jgi:transcriptional regulator with XRE-family HTH domain
MESRAFIKNAKVLTDRILGFEITKGALNSEEIAAQTNVLQKEVNQLFQGLQNPTLPSASKLATLAQNRGFTLDAKVRHRIEQAETFWV